MTNAYELVNHLTSSREGQGANERYLNDFAFELGWKPSYRFVLPETESFTSGHLVVEHGLQNSAVLSFLRRPNRFEDLEVGQRKSLLNASYNNLVDWHIAIDTDNINFIHNRIDPPKFFIQRRRLGRDRTSELTVSNFESVSARHPLPNVPALDTALIRTISFWKRALQVDVPNLSNESASALFNGIILARALEDHARNRQSKPAFTLRQAAGKSVTLRHSIAESLRGYDLEIPPTLWSPEALAPLDSLDTSTINELITDFYKNRFEQYFDYDFSVMSKHALSRIYEHYVSLLRPLDQKQDALFPSLPIEVREKSFGNVYTPEFVARFFARFVRTSMPLHRFQRTIIGDPACGSGIFLRSMIEMKAEALFQERTTKNIGALFESIRGLDVDPNACAAAKLSLSLLSLVLTNEIPKSLDIIQENAMLFATNPNFEPDTLDVIVANPPFVKTEELSSETRGLLQDVLGDKYKGKPDLYLGFLKLALSSLREGGYGCFVLPKNFLLSKNAALIRSMMLEKAIIRCVVDMSAVRVFEEVGAYVILLIFQRTSVREGLDQVLALTCTDLVGQGLEDALQQRETKTAAYQVYWSSQPKASDATWNFPTLQRTSFESRLKSLAKLGDVAEIRQGVITGADDVFIVDAAAVPRAERTLYLPFLPDRDIEPFAVPTKVRRYVFSPYEGEERLTTGRLKEGYPFTWEYLTKNREKLSKRKSIKSEDEWWRPSWPREPAMLLRSKIVTPHLVIAPRFAWDVQGIYAISHTPYLVPRSAGTREEYLYLLAVLNSTVGFWLISQNAHNYSRGYARLEVATLKSVPIPRSSELPADLLRDIIQLAESRLSSTGTAAIEVEGRLDARMSDAYRLSEADRKMIGIGLLTR